MRLGLPTIFLLFLVLSISLIACGGGGMNPGSGTAPAISMQPASESVGLGQTATFSVTATGTAPLIYQWQKGTTNISGATSPSYTTPATTMSDNGAQFRVMVSNAIGDAISNSATLTVNAGPAITTQPTNRSVTVGQTAMFSVTATGAAPLSYQWQKNNTNISGATSANYTTPATTLTDNNATFRVVVSNSVSNVTSSSATLTVTAAAVGPSITTQPANKTVTAGQTATFSVVAAGSAPLSYQWQKNTANIGGATSASYTTPATTTGDNGSSFRVTVTNSAGNITSNSATLTVNAALAVDVLTYHNDIARTGANLNETILTTSNVTSATFGKLAQYSVDGKVDAQPLYAANVVVPGNGTHNLLIVVTEHDTAYAFDADTGTILWQKSMLQSGETTSDTRSCGQVTPEIGITGTPVIDRGRGPNGAIYLVAMSKNGSTYHHRLHALDLATGAELFSGPKEITATYPGTGDNSSGGNVIFDPKQYKERMGLLLMNGVIYTAWASHCDISPYTGWVMGHNADTLALSTVVNIVPNGSLGAFWSAGGGIAADPQGNIYLLAGNGDFTTTLNGSGFPNDGNFGNAFLKLSTSSGLAVADYFEMFNQQQENNQDVDLGSGGAMVLPDFTDSMGQTRRLVIGAGKDTHIYLLDRNNMGKFNSSTNNIYQQLSGALSGGVWSVPAYFNNRVYYGAVGNFLRAFTITNAKLSASSTAQSSNSFTYPGTSPSVSANGTSNGIVWAVENSSTAVLHAYDAGTLNELYNSNQASGNRDHFGGGNKFITPTIVNGRVFVGTPNSVAVFGLLP